MHKAELELIRESNNEEISNLETEKLKLSREIDNIRKNSTNLANERIRLLDCIDDLNEKISFFNHQVVIIQSEQINIKNSKEISEVNQKLSESEKKNSDLVRLIS